MLASTAPVKHTVWEPASLFEESDLKFVLLILNQPILLPPPVVMSLWRRATFRVTVDGGTDQWLQFQKTHYPNEELLPELVTGDLDSILDSTLEYCTSKGVPIAKTCDQNFTDFTKALTETAKWQEGNEKVDAVITLVETAGRLDHILANLNSLLLSRSLLSCPVYQLASNSLAWLLFPGTHKIKVTSTLARGHCSLVPLGAPCPCVTTTGLKWNLEKQTLQFGELVSTSNGFSSSDGGMVTVENDSILLWTMEI